MAHNETLTDQVGNWRIVASGTHFQCTNNVTKEIISSHMNHEVCSLTNMQRAKLRIAQQEVPNAPSHV